MSFWVIFIYVVPGVRPQDRERVLGAERVSRKEEEMHRSDRCRTCWFSPATCICDAIKSLHCSKNVKFLVYMHYKELFNAGDDAKLLFGAFPGRSEVSVVVRCYSPYIPLVSIL